MSHPITNSTRHIAIRLWIPVSLLVLAACGSGSTLSGIASQSPTSVSTPPSPAPSSETGSTTTTPGPSSSTGSPVSSSTSTPTSPSPSPNSGGGGDLLREAIPFGVSGLSAGASVVVVLNGLYSRVAANNLSGAAGNYLFVPGDPASYRGLQVGSSYSITVGTQPAGETCTVTNGSGVLQLTPLPTEAMIACAPVPAATSTGVMHASTMHADIYSNQHQPPARRGASSFTDPSGNLWLFGGSGPNATGTAGHFNDLWQFSPDAGGWNRASGSDVVDTAGRYGTKGVPSPTNAPGARADAMSWTDTSGNLWLFGGQGRDQAGTAGALSDLWKFRIATRQWTWISGSDIANSPGTYGVQNAPSTANRPGARSNAASWIDSAGSLWLFGGYGVDSTGTAGPLDDLWQFTPATSTWTWVSGSITAAAGSLQ
jgi:Galactose oxidase, central domain